MEAWVYLSTIGGDMLKFEGGGYFVFVYKFQANSSASIQYYLVLGRGYDWFAGVLAPNPRPNVYKIKLAPQNFQYVSTNVNNNDHRLHTLIKKKKNNQVISRKLVEKNSAPPRISPGLFYVNPQKY